MWELRRWGDGVKYRGEDEWHVLRPANLSEAAKVSGGVTSGIQR